MYCNRNASLMIFMVVMIQVVVLWVMAPYSDVW